MRQAFATEAQIAEELGVTQQAVSLILKRQAAKLATAFADQAANIRATQTAQLEHLAAEAAAAWERSKLNAESERTVTEEIQFKTDEEQFGDGGELVRRKKIFVPAVKVVVTKTSEGQAGDPRFISEARGALSDIRKIWGLEAATKTEITGINGGALKIQHDIDDLRKMDPAELIRLHSATLGDSQENR